MGGRVEHAAAVASIMLLPATVKLDIAGVDGIGAEIDGTGALGNITK